MKRFLDGSALILLWPLMSLAQSEPSLTPESLRAALKVKPTGTQAEQLAEQIRQYFGGKESLQKGPPPKIEGLLAAWAIEVNAGNAAPRMVSDDGRKVVKLTPVGSTGVYAAVAAFPDQTVQLFHYEVGDKRIASVPVEVYKPDPDSLEKPGVPQGKVTEMPVWRSRIFQDTTRDWWLYLPAQYKPENPACVMVFQDGKSYKDFVPVVFDNLIAKGEMPVTAGIFVAPGVFKDGRPNRSFEYDTLSDHYARFILEEILPEVEKTVKLRHDAASRAIGGISSGGICAFTVAWERPDEFSKVLSWVGSFTNIASGTTLREGGHNYPALIRKTPKKPIRLFLQDGENDLDNAHGNWPLANRQMDRALKFAGYDYKFVMGQGYHNNRHGRAILPNSLRWLWRDYKP
jgi:enterochelin esterase-like enzyme